MDLFACLRKRNTETSDSQPSINTYETMTGLFSLIVYLHPLVFPPDEFGKGGKEGAVYGHQEPALFKKRLSLKLKGGRDTEVGEVLIVSPPHPRMRIGVSAKSWNQ
ncbi:unnamed protein product [Lepidochelys kempii]